MTTKSGDTAQPARESREARRARALRANLARRKAQARTRLQSPDRARAEPAPPKKTGA